MKTIAHQMSDHLLQIKAIKLEPQNHFTWASGWFSPIYCDNRKTLSFPEVRGFIRDSFAQIAKEKFGEFDVIAGVATGGIAHGALVAEALDKPFAYVRAKSKGHGMGNKIEGVVEKGQKVLVIEDLISTGKSSLDAGHALRDAGCEVEGMIAIFTYDFDVAKVNFEEAGVKLHTLSNYHALLEQATTAGYIKDSEVETLKEWRKDPGNWKK
ncbi:MAG: orotate phosphoribosyltransferase [Bacteroidota bacterium]